MTVIDGEICLKMGAVFIRTQVTFESSHLSGIRLCAVMDTAMRDKRQKYTGREVN